MCEVKSEVAEFKSGLEMAYGMIKDLQAQHEKVRRFDRDKNNNLYSWCPVEFRVKIMNFLPIVPENFYQHTQFSSV